MRRRLKKLEIEVLTTQQSHFRADLALRKEQKRGDWGQVLAVVPVSGHGSGQSGQDWPANRMG